MAGFGAMSVTVTDPSGAAWQSTGGRTQPSIWNQQPSASGSVETKAIEPSNGSLTRRLAAVRREPIEAADAAVQGLDVDAVAGAGERLDARPRPAARPRWRWRSWDRRVLGLHDAVARRVLVGQQIEVVCPTSATPVTSSADVQTLAPDRLAGDRGGQRADVEIELVLHAADDQAQRHVATRPARRRPGTRCPRSARRGRGRWPAPSRRSPDRSRPCGTSRRCRGSGPDRRAWSLPCSRLTKTPTAVRGPGRTAELGAVERVGQHLAGGGLEEAQHRVLRPGRRGPVGHAACRPAKAASSRASSGCRRWPGCRGRSAAGPVPADALADVELEGVGADRAQLGEHVGARRTARC